MYTQKHIDKLPDLKKQYQKLGKDKLSLERQMDKISDRIRELELITEFYENIPLYISEPNKDDYTHAFRICNVPENDLEARLYHSAHAPQDVDRWGLVIYDYGSTKIFKDTCLGAHFHKDEAVKIAKDWVIGKGLPEGLK